jgi:hypothetical protein
LPVSLFFGEEKANPNAATLDPWAEPMTPVGMALLGSQPAH